MLERGVKEIQEYKHPSRKGQTNQWLPYLFRRKPYTLPISPIPIVSPIRPNSSPPHLANILPHPLLSSPPL